MINMFDIVHKRKKNLYKNINPSNYINDTYNDKPFESVKKVDYTKTNKLEIEKVIEEKIKEILSKEFEYKFLILKNDLKNLFSLKMSDNNCTFQDIDDDLSVNTINTINNKSVKNIDEERQSNYTHSIQDTDNSQSIKRNIIRNLNIDTDIENIKRLKNKMRNNNPPQNNRNTNDIKTSIRSRIINKESNNNLTNETQETPETPKTNEIPKIPKTPKTNETPETPKKIHKDPFTLHDQIRQKKPLIITTEMIASKNVINNILNKKSKTTTVVSNNNISSNPINKENEKSKSESENAPIVKENEIIQVIESVSSNDTQTKSNSPASTNNTHISNNLKPNNSSKNKKKKKK